MDIRTKLASSVAEHYLKTQTEPEVPTGLPLELGLQRACYVYIYQKPGNRLRAVYGDPLVRKLSLAQEIVRNTVKAIMDSTITKWDLASITFSVAVLEPMQRIGDESRINPQNMGMYVRSDSGKSAVVLPQRPGLETGQDMLATAVREAKIDLKREGVTMYQFQVVYYE